MKHEAPDHPREDQFRLLVESVKDYAIFLLDTEGRVMSWNAGAERIKGYYASEIIGKHFSIFYPPNEARLGRPEYALRVAAEEGRYEIEGWRLRKDGSRFWASVVITALRDPGGTLVGFAKVTRDLTERRTAQEQISSLLELERAARAAAEDGLARLRAIQSVTEVALAHLTLDDLLAALLEKITEVFAAETAVVLLRDKGDALVPRAAHGIDADVLRSASIPVGRGFAGRVAAERRPLVLDDVEDADVLAPALKAKGVRALLGVPLEAHGRLLGVAHVGTRRAGEFRKSDVELFQIIADRIATAIENAQLYEAAVTARQEAARAEEAVRVRNEFLGIAAHELKTPLTSAKAAVQLLRRMLDADALTPTQARVLGTVEDQITNLARLVGRLLDTVRLEGGAMAIEPVEADLASLVRTVAAQMQLTTDRHEIAVEGPDRLHARVDPFRMEQVLINLLDNAVKYMPAGGRIEVELAAAPDAATIAVRDRGIGVPPEHRARLFDRFYQAHPDRSGMGLGLYITREIVELHGGAIEAEFPEDGGTRFVVRIPTIESAAVAAADGADALSRSG